MNFSRQPIDWQSSLFFPPSKSRFHFLETFDLGVHILFFFLLQEALLFLLTLRFQISVMKPSASGFVDLDMIRALCVGSNQDGTRIGVGHEEGFIVYSMMNAAQQHRRMLQATTLDVDGLAKGGSMASVSSGGDPADSPQLVEDFRFPRLRMKKKSAVSGKDLDDDDDSDSLLFQRQASEGEPSPTKGANNAASDSAVRKDAPAVASDSAAVLLLGYGVGAIALLGDTRFVAVTGGGKRPVCSSLEVHIFDRDTVLRHIQLRSPVRRVLMVGTRLLASLTTSSIHLHTFTGISLFDSPASGGELHSPPMPMAACHFSSTIAYPESENRIQLVCFRDDPDVSRVLQAAVEAHQNPVTALALSPEGSLFATSSERGTLIRVWNSSDGSQVSEVRNSSTASVIRQLCFIGTSHLFCVSSDKVKVFFAQGRPPESQPWEDRSRALAGNAQLGYLKSLSVLSTYFASQWAMCECAIPSNFTPSCLQLPDSTGSSGSLQATSVITSTAAVASSTIASVSGWVTGLWRSAAPVPSSGPIPSSLTASREVEEGTTTTGPSPASPLPYYTAKTLDDLVLLRWECYARVGKATAQQQQQLATGPKDLLVISGEGAVLRMTFDPVKGTVTPMVVLQAAPPGS